ncbi:MAG: MarR family transcriptional regulator [Candidatus Korobacteraceae bacterium]
MTRNRWPEEPNRRPTGVAFLLTQLGTHAAQRFGERIVALGLTPPDAGMLRKIASDPGISQQELADHLGIMPSRMVALVDELERKGIVKRKRSTEDRRSYALALTTDGRQVLRELSHVAADHEQALCAGLSEEEKLQLGDLLRRIAEEQGLKPGVHPGYRQLGNKQ